MLCYNPGYDSVTTQVLLSMLGYNPWYGMLELMLGYNPWYVKFESMLNSYPGDVMSEPMSGHNSWYIRLESMLGRNPWFVEFEPMLSCDPWDDMLESVLGYNPRYVMLVRYASSKLKLERSQQTPNAFPTPPPPLESRECFGLYKPK